MTCSLLQRGRRRRSPLTRWRTSHLRLRPCPYARRRPRAFQAHAQFAVADHVQRHRLRRQSLCSRRAPGTARHSGRTVSSCCFSCRKEFRDSWRSPDDHVSSIADRHLADVIAVAAATASSGLPVHFVASPSSICTSNADLSITLVAPGLWQRARLTRWRRPLRCRQWCRSGLRRHWNSRGVYTLTCSAHKLWPRRP